MGTSLVDTEMPGDLAAVEKQLREAVTSPPEEKTTQQQSDDKQVTPEGPQDDDNVPAKLRGKSREEIIEYYRNLESAYGRQANDLGQQRVLTDRLLGLKRESDLASNGNPPSREQVPKFTTQELLDDPSAVIERAVEARLQAEQRKQQEERQLSEKEVAARKFLDAHPDYQEVSNSPEFAKWINESKTRLRAAQRARSGDFEEANDLLSEYKASKAKPVTVTPKEDSGVSEAKKVSLETSTAKEHASQKSSGRIYRRADLIRLKMEKPDLYHDETFQKEIMQAYLEKRVK